MSTTIALGTHHTHGAPATRRGRDDARGWPVIAAVTLVFMVAIAVMPTLSDLPPRPLRDTTVVRVEPSDSPWSLARAHTVPGATTAQTAQAIRDINGLGTRHLVAGSTVRVPAARPSGSAMAARPTGAP